MTWIEVFFCAIEIVFIQFWAISEGKCQPSLQLNLLFSIPGSLTFRKEDTVKQPATHWASCLRTGKQLLMNSEAAADEQQWGNCWWTTVRQLLMNNSEAAADEQWDSCWWTVRQLLVTRRQLLMNSEAAAGEQWGSCWWQGGSCWWTRRQLLVNKEAAAGERWASCWWLHLLVSQLRVDSKAVGGGR